ncbi:MAG: putative quinol monooxygenase, partial [Haloarculaceae archaeon]
MIVLHATVPIDAEYREDALDVIEDLAVASRAEDGVIDYRATTDVEDPNTVRFFEHYEDEAAFEAHLETDHYLAFAHALPEWLAGEPEVVRFDVSEA